MTAARKSIPVLLVGVAIAAMDIAVLGPALRAIGATFALDERALAWVFIVFSLFSQLGNPVMSGMSDVYGRRFAFTWCMGLYVAGTLVVVFSPTYASMLLGRALQGCGVSGLVPIAGAVIGDVFPMERRGRMLGVIGAVFGASFIVGPLVSGFLLQWGSWRWLFVVSLPLALYAGVAGLVILPRTHSAASARLDWVGVVLLGGAMASLTYAINQIDAAHVGASLVSGRVAPFLGGFAVLLAAFVAWERVNPNPVLRLSLLGSRQVVIVCLVSVGAGATEAVFVFLPLFAAVSFGVTDRVASFMLLPLVTALAVGSPLFGRLLDRVGSRAIVLIGTLATTVGLVLAAISEGRLLAYHAGGVAMGLGLSALLGSAVGYILLNESVEAERTMAQGMGRLFKAAGRLAGGALIGAVVASSESPVEGYPRAFAVIALGMGAMHALSYGLKRRGAERG